MPYIPIQERQKKFKFKTVDEFNRLIDDIKKSWPIISSLFKSVFARYPFRNHELSTVDFINNGLIENIGNNKEISLEDKYIYSCEWIFNVLFHIKNYKKISYFDRENLEKIDGYFTLVHDRSSLILSYLGYKYTLIESSPYNYINITKTNTLAENAALLIENKKVAFDILKFNHHGITYEEKTKLIEEMYKYFEGIRSSSPQNVAKTIANIMNNGLRHNHKERIKNTKVEKYIEKNPNVIDDVYNLLIECFYHQQNISIISTIKSLSK